MRLTVVATCLLSISMVVCARAQTERSDVVSGVLSTSREERLRTRDKMIRYRLEVASELLKILDQPWEKDFSSGTVTAITILGMWAEPRAIPVLVKNIDMEFPAPEGSYSGDNFLCVEALISIGGVRVREAVIAEIPRHSSNPRVLGLIALILQQIDRRQVAERVLDDCIESATSDEHKATLQKVRLYLDPKKRLQEAFGPSKHRDVRKK